MEVAHIEITKLRIRRSLRQRLDVVVYSDVCEDELELVGREEAAGAVYVKSVSHRIKTRNRMR